MNSKRWLIVSVLCIVAGLILLLASGFRNIGDLDSILEKAGAAETLKEKTVTVTENFDSIAVKEADADVKLLPSGDESCRVVYGENEQIRYSVKVENKTLTVSREDKSVSFGTSLHTREIPLQIYLPEQSYRSLRIESASGDVLPERGFSFEKAEISTASGEIKLRDFQAGELRLHTASGDAVLEEVTAESLLAESASGDPELCRCSLGTLRISSISGEQSLKQVQIDREAAISSTSGEITLAEVEAGALDISCTSGKVRLDKLSCAGAVKVETTSGDIVLRSAAAASFDLHTTSGDVEGDVLGTVDFIVDTLSGSVRTRGGVRGAAPCTVKTTSGDVELEAGK